MSRFVDATQLALTKLKTRRVRLSITIIISSVLFCLLLGIAFTVNGTLKSIEKFRGAGFSNRYIVSAYPTSSPYTLLSDAKLIAKAKNLQKQVIERKKTEAKKLGVNYDPLTETPYVNEVEQGPGDKVKQLNTEIPEVAALLAERLKQQPGNHADFLKVSKKYNAATTYESVSINSGSISGGPPSLPYLSPLKDGKEDFNQQASFKGFAGDLNGINSLSSQWQLFSSDLLKPFTLKGQSLDLGEDGSIPIIAPYSAVEQMLGLKALPATASSNLRLERLKEVRTKAAGYKFDVCYRNQASNSQIQQVIQQQQEITAGKSKNDYQLPELIRDLPSKPCGPVRITRDVRSAEQKKSEANEALFRKKFGEPDPESKILHLRIIGINSDIPTGGSVSVTQVFQSILLSSLGQGWSSPIELADSEPTLPKIFNLRSLDDSFSQVQYAEFRSSGEVEKVLNEQNCQPNFDFSVNPSGADPYKECTAQGKYFSFTPFGSSSVAIDHFKKGFDKVFLIAGLIISAVAALILMGTIGRIIADSRRETAVFRAIGAKRRDIAQIYFLYTVMVGLLIAITSTVLGYLISQFINARYSPSVTVDALVAFNVPDLNQRFSMSSLYLKDVFYVTALIIVAALLASLIPLMTNLRRNPIRDMRDER